MPIDSVVIILICLIFILLCVASLVVLMRDALVTDAPFIPTRAGAVTELAKALDLHSDSILYDLGCGDARILVSAVQSCPGVRGVGVEKGLIPYLIARIRSHGLPIIIKREDIFTTNISNATRIYCYLYPKVLEKLEAKFKKECKPGTRIITTDFIFPTLTPIRKIELDTNAKHLARTLYIYSV